MKPELTIKHLAPYLPYRLRIVTKTAPNTILLGISNLGSFPIKYANWDGLAMSSDYKDIKPILKPLLSVTDVELEQFGYNEEQLELLIYGQKAPRWLWNELLEKHFDVFLLIEKGLAISYNDVTELKQ